MGTNPSPSPIKVSAATKEKIRLAAALTGRSQSDLVSNAVDEYLAAHGGEIATGLRQARTKLAAPKPRRRVSLATLRERRDEIVSAAASHGAHHVRVFGSAARGDRDSGDVDLLVRFDDGRSLLDHIRLVDDLEQLLGVRVDVVEDEALHRSIRDRVLSEAVPL